MGTGKRKRKASPSARPLIRERNPVKRFLKILGPGLITGASDDDPSGIGTYALAGASLGFSTLWTALVTFPMMTAVQFICAEIGMVWTFLIPTVPGGQRSGLPPD
jgi:Mn2+/Fe2+ NRAMP family transporter